MGSSFLRIQLHLIAKKKKNSIRRHVYAFLNPSVACVLS
jgi:hypothetical protein